jgi:hypothetical protein
MSNSEPEKPSSPTQTRVPRLSEGTVGAILTTGVGIVLVGLTMALPHAATGVILVTAAAVVFLGLGLWAALDWAQRTPSRTRKRAGYFLGTLCGLAIVAVSAGGLCFGAIEATAGPTASQTAGQAPTPGSTSAPASAAPTAPPLWL